MSSIVEKTMHCNGGKIAQKWTLERLKTIVATRLFSPSINSDNLSFERPFVVELSVYFQRLSLLD